MLRRRRDSVEERLVWMLGSPRTGSTWLLNLLCAHERVMGIDEPNVGMHLGIFSADVFGHPADTFDPDAQLVHEIRATAEDYVFAERYAAAWRPALRELLLARFGAQVPAGMLCAIKEPNGSQGAGLIMGALPKSRLLFVVRDGRDVVDSETDAAKKGSWLSAYGGGRDMTPAERMAWLRERAWRWRVRTEVVQGAYDAHDPGLRLKLRYEDLLGDTPRHVREILSWLELDEPAGLDDTIERMSFAALPAERKGSGRFARAATPGLWRESFSADEQAAVEAVAGDTLRAQGYT